MWTVEVVGSYGEPEKWEGEAECIGDAITDALRELGYDGNDEGSLTIKIDGEGDIDEPVNKPAKKRKKGL